MDWSAFAGVIAAAIGAVAGAGWLARDRDRNKLERDVEMYQKNLPVPARRDLAVAIAVRENEILMRESANDRRFKYYVQGVSAIWYAGYIAYCAWGVSKHPSVITWLLLGIGIIAPVVYFGYIMRYEDKQSDRMYESLIKKLDRWAEADSKSDPDSKSASEGS